MGLYTVIYGTGIGDGALSLQRLAQLTNPDKPQLAAAGSINTTFLQRAVFCAQATFQNETATPYDDVTVDAAGPPVVVNKCHPLGIQLTIAWLYRLRGLPEEAQLAKVAWEEALREVKAFTMSSGGGAWAPPTSDSLLQPSQQAAGSLPAFDDQTLARMVPNSPQPAAGRAPAGVNQWNGGA